MSRDERLQIAIAKAKSGHELSARDLFIDIVEDDPENKLAWLWLIGLLDDRGDLIIACEQVLEIDPTEERVRLRLEKFRQEEVVEKECQEKAALSKVDSLLRHGNTKLALSRLRKIVQENHDAEVAWSLLAKHSPDFDEQVEALTRIQALDPANEEKRAALYRARYFQTNPLELAASHEERGEIDEAIALYERLTIKAQGRKEWDRLFREIHRLKALQQEKIVHISPALTVGRLMAGPPLLFFSMVIIQIGYDPNYFTLLMAAEFLLVILGAFLAAVASAGSEHFLWKRLGNAAGRGSKRLRILVGAAGVTILLLPFALLGIEAYMRWMTVFDYLGYDF